MEQEELAADPVTRWYSLLSLGGLNWSAWYKVQPDKAAYLAALSSTQRADVDVWEGVVRRWLHRGGSAREPPKLSIFLKAAGSDQVAIVIRWVSAYESALSRAATPFPPPFNEYLQEQGARMTPQFDIQRLYERAENS